MKKRYLIFVPTVLVSLVLIYMGAGKEAQHTEKEQKAISPERGSRLGVSREENNSNRASANRSQLKVAVQNLEEMNDGDSKHRYVVKSIDELTEEQLALSKEADSRYFDVMPKKLDLRWRQEESNPEFTKIAKAQIEKMMVGYVSDTTVFENVDCRGELCKAVFKTNDRVTMEDFKEQWRNHGPDNRQNMGNWSEDGDQLKVTIFFVKKGGENLFANLRREIHEEVKEEMSF